MCVHTVLFPVKVISDQCYSWLYTLHSSNIIVIYFIHPINVVYSAQGHWEPGSYRSGLWTKDWGHPSQPIKGHNHTPSHMLQTIPRRESGIWFKEPKPQPWRCETNILTRSCLIFIIKILLQILNQYTENLKYSWAELAPI